MSGSLNNIYNNISFALHLNSDAMLRLQEQASTGSRINRASDDPSTAYRVLGLNSQERSMENYMDNINQALSTLEISLTIVGDITSAISETKVFLTQITGGIYGQSGKDNTAEGINNTLDQIISLANTKHMNQYLFGGSNTGSAPYVTQSSNGEVSSVTYQGSFQDRNIEVGPGVQSSAFYIGEDVFSSDNRSTPVFLGDSGAAAGTGTSSVKGDVWLTITGSTGNWTLSVDGGTAVTSDGTDTNLAVKSTTGEVLYVDTRGIKSTSVEMVRVPGTYDVFNTLISIRDILRNEKGVSEAQQLTQLRSSLESLEEIRSLLVEKSISMGSKIGFLDNFKNTLENIKYDTKDEATGLQEADITQVAIDMSRREVLYQMSLSVAAKLMSMSLLDFIQ